MADTIECVVIGAGVVGLAVARRMARAGIETVVIERESHIGTATSSRNSEVVHAGIYYLPGSLKARLCVTGKEMLYRYCDVHGVDYRRCGKLIVAAAEEHLPKLRQIVANGRANGVDDLELLEPRQARVLEPKLACAGAILSPSTGIVDSHGLMLALRGDLEAAGGMIAFRSPVVGGEIAADAIRLSIGEDTVLHARRVVNCAGLHAQQVAGCLAGYPRGRIPTRFLAKGSYFSLDVRAPFERLIYPLPDGVGLGVHLTLDLAGRARFGPDVEWVEKIDYSVDPAKSARYYAEVRKYWPQLPDGSLSPGYAGIRPNLGGPGSHFADFCIEGPGEHGIAGLVSLFGIESPGLTSSLAIANHVAGLLKDD